VIPGPIRAELATLIQGVEGRTGAEIAILTVPTTAPLEPVDYAARVFERWGIGKKGRDNGVLLLVATNDRRIWITVGYGLESVLPDAKVAEIRDWTILPLFRQGQYGEGVLEGTRRIAALIATGAGQTVPGSRTSLELVVGLRFVLLLLLLVLALEILWRLAAGWVLALGQRGSVFYVAALLAGAAGVIIPPALVVYVVVLPVVPVARCFARWRPSRRLTYDDGWDGGHPRWPGEFSSGGFGGFGGGETGGGGAGGDWDFDLTTGLDLDAFD